MWRSGVSGVRTPCIKSAISLSITELSSQRFFKVYIICIVNGWTTKIPENLHKLFLVVLQSNEEKKKRETKLSSKLISQNEKFHARRRAVAANRAPCI